MNSVNQRAETINEKAVRYKETTGKQPTMLKVSREMYRRLVELKSLVCCVGDFVVGCVPVTEIQTSVGTLNVIIDELLDEADVHIE